jgi:heterodisulfide reductase subunit A-like polyferredoxin
MKEERPTGAVLVYGGGIAGIQASLDLADSGFKVYLVERSSAVGGRMPQLDKTFPTGDCAMCILSPKLVECGRNKNIETITLGEIEGISGEPGHFEVAVRRSPRYVDLTKCNGCGACAEVCPVSLPNAFDRGLGERRAIFREYPQAVPNAFTIAKADGTAPCKLACPAGVNAQGYVALIGQGKFKEAYDVIRERCPLPSVCGRICQHPCEAACNRGEVDDPVAIRDLKRFTTDWVYSHRNEIDLDGGQQPAEKREERVAVIGGGPAGLTAAYDLTRMGYGVTIFDAMEDLGGMLRSGVPAYRLPRDLLDYEIQCILKTGVEARTGVRVSDPTSLLKTRPEADSDSAATEKSPLEENETARHQFDAVFVATGAWTSRQLSVPGEDADGVWPGLKFLHEVNSGARPEVGSNVLVIGGGDVAMDVARCARRLPGVESVHLACLERRDEMPAHSWEAAEALDEGVTFHNSLGPTEILAQDGKVTGVAFRACTRVYDEAGRFSPQFEDSQTSSLAADTVIVAIGQGVDAASMSPVTSGPGGRVIADPRTLATNVPGVFAGGDVVLGPASAIDAIAHGHRAAEAIHRYLRGAGPQGEPVAGEDAPRQASNPRPNAPRRRRLPMPQASAEERTRDMREIDLGYSEDDAVAEAQRCLNCGLCSDCRLCEKACGLGAIAHNMRPQTDVLHVGAVIVTPGSEEIEASLRGEYGHGRYANVLSSVQFERMLSASGPTEGTLVRPSDRGPVRRVAFIQCVGSRDNACGNGYCSALCCMSATKEAMVALEHEPGLEIAIFCIDVRAFGKEFDRYVSRAQSEQGVRYVRAIPSRVAEMPGSKDLRLRYFDDEGAEQTEDFDLVVLSVGLKPGVSAAELAERLGIDRNEFGFCETNRLTPVVSSRPGVFVAGAFQEPKDIPESVAQASAAAAAAMELLRGGRGTLVQRHEYPSERDVTDEEPRVGVFICHCGHNIASVVDVEAVAREAAAMGNVVHAETDLYTCSDNNQASIRQIIKQKRLNRLVVASCSPRTHEPLFQETLRESGLNPFLFAMANIRDQCSWVHRDDPIQATQKACDLMRMAVGRARLLRPQERGRLPITRASLVLGGGLAGMTAALSLADQGFETHLVEKADALGGNLRSLHYTLERADVQRFAEGLIDRVQAHPLIDTHLRSDLVEFNGHVGNFNSVIRSGGQDMAISHGVAIIATGAVERVTEAHLRGKNERVVTQRELEARLANGDLAGLGESPTVVMVQCVGSRTEENNYCSRVCCAEAVKNALALKARRPDTRVVVLAKDIRTYGFRETYYQKAREAGILFVRYPESEEPLTSDEDGLTVRVKDAGTRRTLLLRPHLLVLSTGIAPAPDNQRLSSVLRTSLTADGFFLEAHPKLRPVDLASEGVFVCGLAHSPRFMDETIAQALAAAARAATILSKPYLEIGGQVAKVDATACTACMTCAKVCPYGAPVLVEHKVEIQEAKCLGCGSCASACPAQAIQLQHQEDRQLTAMLDELLVGARHD